MLNIFKKTLERKLTVAAISLVALSTAPLTVSADDESIARGKIVFDTVAGIGCKTCHGEYGEGDLGVGPYLRGATEGAVRAAIEGIDAMVAIKNVINEEQTIDVSNYVNSLGATRVVRSMAKRGRFLPDTITVPPESSLRIVINNASFSPKNFASEDFDLDGGLGIDARTTNSFVWTSPESGEFKVYCTDCDIDGEFLTVTVDPNAPKPKPFVPTTAVGQAAGT